MDSVGQAADPAGPCDLVNAESMPVAPVDGAGVFLAPGPGAQAEVRLRRYATVSHPVDLGALEQGLTRLSIPSDASTQPWELQLTGSGQVRICELAG
jgi:hypothetical protein